MLISYLGYTRGDSLNANEKASIACPPDTSSLPGNGSTKWEEISASFNPSCCRLAFVSLFTTDILYAPGSTCCYGPLNKYFVASFLPKLLNSTCLTKGYMMKNCCWCKFPAEAKGRFEQFTMPISHVSPVFVSNCANRKPPLKKSSRKFSSTCGPIAASWRI